MLPMVTAPPEYEAKLRELLVRFLEENTKLNLSALRTEESCWLGNILDSLAFLSCTEINIHGSHLRVLDVGSGGGFPLLPLAVCLPQHAFVGMDSIGKKMEAVRRIATDVGIRNASVCIGRAEELGHKPEHREQYDVVISRAVASIATLLEYNAPFVKVGGHIVLWKSLHIDDELQESLAARSELSCHLQAQCTYELPSPWGARQLLVFKKAAATKPMYPREVGEAKRNPLQ